MLTISNYSIRPVNNINFKSNPQPKYHQLTVSDDSKEIFILADECLKAYKKGGLLIHIENNTKKEDGKSYPGKSERFVANMLTESNLDINGNELNLYDCLINLTDQEIASEFIETRVNRWGDTKEIIRYKLADGSIVDKDLYDFTKYLANFNSHQRESFAKNNCEKYKANIGDYIILYEHDKINIIDKKGNIVGKKFRFNGLVSDVLNSKNEKGIHYNLDGTTSDRCTPPIRMFFSYRDAQLARARERSRKSANV